ncbi:MAG TPA: LCP family protein [Trebonia sp.]|nr:LCP family protein [Trebonia sp.]
MSDDWPQGWYQNDSSGAPTRAASPQGMRGQNGPGRGAWPNQPPSSSYGSPSYGRGSSYGDPAQGGRSPGSGYDGQPGYGGGGPRRRWRFWGQPGHRGRRIVTYLVTLVVLLVLLVVGSYFYINGKVNRTVTLPADATATAGTNWLITGADTRNGLTREQIDQDHVGFDFGTANSDSIMLLHMGTTGKPVLVSIPRDSYVDIPGKGWNKINAALSGGPTLLIKTVEAATGLQINHYMGIGFGGLVNVVNQVGGVQVCLPAPLKDSDSGLNLPKGCSNLNGTQALAFVRDRHSFATEDLQREQDQRLFLQALMKKAVTPGVYLNPFTAIPFGSTAASSITVDKGTSLWDLYQVSQALKGPLTTTVPIANANYSTSAGDAVLWNKTQASELFNDLAQGKAVPSSLITGTKVG